MRKINMKVLVGLIAGTVVCAGLVFAIHFFQSRRIADALLWQARRAEEADQLAKVVRYLSRYLEFRPGDIEEKAHLGRTLVSEQLAGGIRHKVRGLDLLETVLREQPQRNEERRLLVKTALGVGRLKTARDALEVLWEDVQANPQEMSAHRGEVEGYWGMLNEAERKPAEALSWYRKAIEHAPGIQSHYERLAYLLRESEEKSAYAEADQVMNALVKANPESPEAHLARWVYRRRFDLVQLPGQPGKKEHTLEEAADDIRIALKQAPESIEILLAAADMERLRNQRHLAREYLKRGLDIHGHLKVKTADDTLPKQLLWQLTNVLLDGALNEKEDPRVVESDLEEARRRIEQFRKLRSAAGGADYLEARLLLQGQRWGEAVVLLERSRSLLQERPELIQQIDLYLGLCYDKLEEPAQMYEAFQRVASADPGSTTALVGMANALWSQGRLDEAMGNFQKVMARDEVPEKGWQEIARLEILRQLQKDKAERDWKLAETALERAAKLDPRSVSVGLLRAEVQLAQEKTAEAEQTLLELKEQKPEREDEVWAALVELADRTDDTAGADSLLEEAEKAVGDLVGIRLARARHAVRTQPKTAAEVLTRQEKDLDKFESADQAKLLQGLAQLHFQLGGRGEARRLSEQLTNLDQHKTDLRLHSFLFDLALKEGDEAGMEQTLAKIQEIEQSRGVYYRYGRALQLLWKVRQGNPSGAQREAVLLEARQHLELASRQRPSWPPIHLARAEIYELEGNPEQAILELKQAIQKGENSPAVVQRLVRALVSRKRDAEADEELKKLKQTLLVQSELGRLAAHVALGRGDTARALALARDAVAVDSPDYGDQVWMGRLLSAANVHDEAEHKLRKAIEGEPAKPEAWVALVQLLASRNRTEDAQTVLGEAEKKIEPKSRALALAQCAEAMGKTKEALELYEKAQKADPNNVMVLRSVIRFSIRLGQRPQAEDLLRQIVDGKVPASKEDVNWARRGLALLLADGIHYDRFQQAIPLVDLSLDAKGRLDLKSLEGKAPTELHRTRARILATQPIRRYREAAIGLFTLLDGLQALTPEDRLILAILLDQTGEWQKARDQYLTLVLPKTDDPRHLTAYVSAMIEHDDLDGVPRWLEQLEGLEKAGKKGVGAFGSVELRVRWMMKRGQKDAALELLRKHVQRASASPGEKLLLAKYLGKEKRLSDALALCEEVWKKCRPEQVEQVSGVTMAVLRSAGQPSEADLARVETWLSDAMKKEPDKVGLHMFLADLYELRGQYREAEAEYRIVLASKEHSTNIVALNNMAWLLTLQVGKQEEALNLISRAIEGYGPRAELLDTRGMIYLALGRHEEALADLKEAADEPNPVRLFHLAQALYEARDRETARRKLEEAREMGLDPARMHPVEQRTCKKMLEEFRL